MDERANTPIERLANLGPKSARVLQTVGIATVGDLERIGCVAAYIRAKHVWEGASLNLLWAMVAGLRGEHWTRLDPAEKAELVAEVEAFCSSVDAVPIGWSGRHRQR